MAANLARRLERLEQLVRAQDLANETPLYFRLVSNDDEVAALNRLVADGKTSERDRDRVVFVVRTPVSAPVSDEGPIPATLPTADIFGADSRGPERFSRPLEYPELGIV